MGAYQAKTFYFNIHKSIIYLGSCPSCAVKTNCIMVLTGTLPRPLCRSTALSSLPLIYPSQNKIISLPLTSHILYPPPSKKLFNRHHHNMNLSLSLPPSLLLTLLNIHPIHNLSISQQQQLLVFLQHWHNLLLQKFHRLLNGTSHK